VLEMARNNPWLGRLSSRSASWRAMAGRALSPHHDAVVGTGDLPGSTKATVEEATMKVRPATLTSEVKEHADGRPVAYIGATAAAVFTTSS